MNGIEDLESRWKQFCKENQVPQNSIKSVDVIKENGQRKAETVNTWLKKIGRPDLTINDLDEYADGQLILATQRLDNINDWRDWQILQRRCGKVIPLDKALSVMNKVYGDDE